MTQGNSLFINTGVRWALGTVCFAVAFATSAPATAVPIIADTTITVNVGGKASVYGVEGLSGSSDTSSDPATSIEFNAAAGNNFEVLSEGSVSYVPGDILTLDGANITRGMPFNFSTNTGPYNGLSGAQGNGFFGLLGVFIDSITFDSTGTAPMTLTWDAENPMSLTPMLNQVFYIGDGRAGLDDPMGMTLMFTAPDAANRLYLGFTDALSGTPRDFFNNVGSLQSSVTLNTTGGMDPGTVPLPGTLALSAIGLFAFGWSRRRASGRSLLRSTPRLSTPPSLLQLFTLARKHRVSLASIAAAHVICSLYGNFLCSQSQRTA